LTFSIRLKTQTAGGYRERALIILDDLRARSQLPVFTVGTGLYFRARCSKGWQICRCVRKNYANDCGQPPSSTALDICTPCSRASTRTRQGRAHFHLRLQGRPARA